jgi:large subunit ribosomal protein L3
MIGVIAQKVGSTLFFDGDGTASHVTLLLVDDCVVAGHRTAARDGYDALVLAAFPARSRTMNKPQRAMLAASGIEGGRRVVREIRLGANDGVPAVGSTLDTSLFSAGLVVDVVGISKGKGFAGAMKRHGFAGLEATHGVSITHRSHGSTGHRTYPSKVFRGKRMAGHMGSQQVTAKNLRVLFVDEEKKLVGVRGAVPGACNGYVMLRHARGTKS